MTTPPLLSLSCSTGYLGLKHGYAQNPGSEKGSKPAHAYFVTRSMFYCSFSYRDSMLSAVLILEAEVIDFQQVELFADLIKENPSRRFRL